MNDEYTVGDKAPRAKCDKKKKKKKGCSSGTVRLCLHFLALLVGLAAMRRWPSPEPTTT